MKISISREVYLRHRSEDRHCQRSDKRLSLPADLPGNRLVIIPVTGTLPD
ncbi:hypothetical protein GCM10023116_33080 [Kistimonas scapharcae]|uniref:Uncharacterized protein n=1 Tax=Kistimonas scapharcae TaxID=1036133 RepID=A0ABP8V712_9GAMM